MTIISHCALCLMHKLLSPLGLPPNLVSFPGSARSFLLSVTKWSHSKRECVQKLTTGLQSEKSLFLFSFIPVKNLKFLFHHFFQFGSPARDYRSLSGERERERLQINDVDCTWEKTVLTDRHIKEILCARNRTNNAKQGLQYRYKVSAQSSSVIYETFKICYFKSYKIIYFLS